LIAALQSSRFGAAYSANLIGHDLISIVSLELSQEDDPVRVLGVELWMHPAENTHIKHREAPVAAMHYEAIAAAAPVEMEPADPPVDVSPLLIARRDHKDGQSGLLVEEDAVTLLANWPLAEVVRHLLANDLVVRRRKWRVVWAVKSEDVVMEI
jgi:hypothetical protein